ncbi:hypothetical protein [Polaribacter glomeratus]|nr:hypothetical protein [Polaribacter glomeratus]
MINVNSGLIYYKTQYKKDKTISGGKTYYSINYEVITHIKDVN